MDTAALSNRVSRALPPGAKPTVVHGVWSCPAPLSCIRARVVKNSPFFLANNGVTADGITWRTGGDWGIVLYPDENVTWMRGWVGKSNKKALRAASRLR